MSAGAPRLAADLAPAGGAPRDPEDFVVEEIPAYPPAGEGEHVFALVEKRGLTTAAAIRAIAEAAGCDPREAGSAGLKDRHAVTRQWVSFAGTDPERLRGLALPGITVLEAARHPHKLRTGHLLGNRFTIRLRGVSADGLARARAILARVEALGLPNYYGPQRFGRLGDNARRGLALLAGGKRGRIPDRELRLLVSALQSAAFNAFVAARLRAGTLRTLLGGEVLLRPPRGGPFVSEDAAVDQPRLDAGEVVVTGPIPGPRMPRPLEGSPARAEEDELLAALGLEPDRFRRFKRLGRGGRRPVVVRPEGLRCAEVEGDLVLDFALPRGSYATVLLAEVTGQPRFAPPADPLGLAGAP